MWPNPQKTAGLVTFTEEIVNEKLRFLCSDNYDVEIVWGRRWRECFFVFDLQSEDAKII